jgi:hypothetical protein
MVQSLKSSSRKRRARLRLESLEERITPSSFPVSDLTDNASDMGSIRYVVNEVNADGSAAADTIDLTGVSGTIKLTNGALGLTRTKGPVIITGPGASSLTISGNNASGVFTFANNVTASIFGLTIAKGSNGNGNGGGINNFGTLIVTDCIFTGNSAGYINSQNGSDGNGGGIYNSGTLTVSGSAFTGNNANVFPSGGFSVVAGGGAIYNNQTGTLSVSGSTFTSNMASASAGGAINSQNGSLTVTDCGFNNDESQWEGGGISQDASSSMLPDF